MKILNNGKISTILIILLLSMSAFLATSMQLVKATNIAAYAYIAAAPNPAGVTSTVLVTAWLSWYPPQPTGTPANTYVFFWNYTITITDPNGNPQTRQIKSDPIGGATFSFVPDKVGTWTLKMNFPTTVASATATYLSATSNTFSLNVTQQPTPSWQAVPLPTGYWTRPINAQNREWAQISGSWMGMPQLGGSPGRATTYDRYGKFNPYTTAPNTPHIIWTKPIDIGGLVGGSSGDNNYLTGNSYEIRGSSSVIISGQLYYNIPLSDWPSGGGFACVDIRTGQTLWTHSGTITFGQLLNYGSLNQWGIIPYLWGYGVSTAASLGIAPNTLEMRSPLTGDLVCTIVNATIANTFVSDANGNILEYVLNAAQKTLILWNSTQCILGQVPPNAPAGTSPPPTYWRPIPGGLYDWKVGIMWNVTVPNMPAGISIIRMSDNVILARASSAGAYALEVGLSTTDGHLLWARNDTDPNTMIAGQEATYGYVLWGDYYAHLRQETMQWYGYNINTGAQIWTSDPYTNPWGSYYTTIGDGPAYVAYGKIYAAGYDGTLHCIDITNGKTLWNTYIGSAGNEVPYGQYPFFGSFVIADGKIYVGNGEHSPNTPIYRGESIWCFDANTGSILYKMQGWWQDPMIADGYLVALNAYDMRWYGFGKGQTDTTVQTPLNAVVSGSQLAITGTVYDMSPGVPAKTPAVSKDSMEPFMKALYEQQVMPNNITGVSLQIAAIDSSGASTTIGTVTTDSTGFYITHWQAPSAAGDYRIIASFAGDDSYWSSNALAGITVVAPASTPTPLTANDVANQVVAQLPTPVPATPAPSMPSASDVAAQVVSQVPNNTMMYTIVAAVVIAILIGLVNLVLLLRKKQA